MNFADKNSTDQELDNLFRRAHANELPPPSFNDAFFAEIEGLLPPVEKKRKGIIFWCTIPAAAVFVGVYFGFNFGNEVSFNFNAPKIQASTEIQNKQTIKESSHTNLVNDFNQTHINSSKPKNKKENQLKLESPFRSNPFDDHSNVRITKGVSFGRDNYNSTRSKLTIDPLTAKKLVALNVVTDSIPLLPLDKKIKTDYFVQFGLLVGQSPRKDVSGNSNLLLGFSVGTGLKRYVNKMGIEFGLNYRYEHLNNAIWNDQVSIENPTTGVVNTYARQIDIASIHSIEFPLVFSFENPRNSLGFIVSPGIQLLFNGEEFVYIDQEKVRSKKSFNPSETSSTLTMEMGIQHAFHINEHFSLLTILRTDILRPFNQDNFSGENTLLPLNGQVALRYRF